MAEHSKDRYTKGDEYNWASLDLRFAQAITQNFQMVYDAGYQYMDLDNGTKTPGVNNSASGSFYRLTIAPTFKLDTSEFFMRPELRFMAVSYTHLITAGCTAPSWTGIRPNDGTTGKRAPPGFSRASAP